MPGKQRKGLLATAELEDQVSVKRAGHPGPGREGAGAPVSWETETRAQDPTIAM